MVRQEVCVFAVCFKLCELYVVFGERPLLPPLNFVSPLRVYCPFLGILIGLLQLSKMHW